jgi:hypothetical protein
MCFLVKKEKDNLAALLVLIADHYKIFECFRSQKGDCPRQCFFTIGHFNKLPLIF